MANVTWRGDAPAVAQVDTLTVGGTIEVGDVFTVTINGKAVSISASTTSVTTTATEIYTALIASTIPEFLEISWANPSAGVITATANEAGKPFTLTATTTEAGGGAADAQTFVRSATTASSGPNDWSIAANWSGAAIPANGDNVYIQNSNVPILYGLSQSGVTLASLNVDASFQNGGRIGLPRHTGLYWEYRPTYLAIGATAINIGAGEGNGSDRIKIDTGSVQTTLSVYKTGAGAEEGIEALLWKGTHASNLVQILRGSVGGAVFGGETATVATLRTGYLTDRAGDSMVRCGSGTTLTTLEQEGGRLTVNSAFTTLTKDGGTFTANGTGGATTIGNTGGVVYWNSSGTIATVNVAGEEADGIDFTQDMRGKTVTNCNRYGRAFVRDPFKVVTFTNGVDCEQSDMRNIDLGTNIKLTRGAVT